MPEEAQLPHGGRAEIENRLKVRDVFSLLIHVIIRLNRGVEEVARRHLLRVTDHDQLLRAVDRADSVLREDLRRFVKDHHIEMHGSLREISAHAERRHEETRFQRLNHVASLCEKRSDALQTALLFALMTNDGNRASARHPIKRRAFSGKLRLDNVFIQFKLFGVFLTEDLNRLVLRNPVKGIENRA